jgi:hypothetical protein
MGLNCWMAAGSAKRKLRGSSGIQLAFPTDFAVWVSREYPYCKTQWKEKYAYVWGLSRAKHNILYHFVRCLAFQLSC